MAENPKPTEAESMDRAAWARWARKEYDCRVYWDNRGQMRFQGSQRLVPFIPKIEKPTGGDTDART